MYRGNWPNDGHSGTFQQAIVPTDLYILTREDLEDVLSEFPEYYQELRETCNRRAEEFAKRRKKHVKQEQKVTLRWEINLMFNY